MKKHFLINIFALVFILMFTSAVTLLPHNVRAASDFAWKQQIGSGKLYWSSIVSSADGNKLAAIGNGYIYTSIDSGVTWTKRIIDHENGLFSITSSADGLKLAAVDYIMNNFYTSVDGGATWTKRIIADEHGWSFITSSADGIKLAAVSNSQNNFYTSVDNGVTWTQRIIPGKHNWYSITLSADGTKVAAADAFGYIYTSADSGVTWKQQPGAGQHMWHSITSSADGTKLAAAEGGDGGYIYTSTDSGVTWKQQTSADKRYWISISSSADGNKLAAIGAGGLSVLSGANYVYTYGPNKASVATTATTTIKPIPIKSVVKAIVFNKDLKLNNVSSDVKELQKYLNNHGYIVAKTGVGSKGKEAIKFTQATKNALIKFQKANKIKPASGILDSNTRKVINKIK